MEFISSQLIFPTSHFRRDGQAGLEATGGPSRRIEIHLLNPTSAGKPQIDGPGNDLCFKSMGLDLYL